MYNPLRLVKSKSSSYFKLFANPNVLLFFHLQASLVISGLDIHGFDVENGFKWLKPQIMKEKFIKPWEEHNE